MTAGFAEVNGTRLHYDVTGQGHPLVLNHAGVADSRMWDDQVGVFARRYRVVRWDARGYGESPEPPGPYSGRGDLYALLRHLGVERAHVMGLSMGGGTAIEFALGHPDMVATLIPVASALSGYEQPPNPIRPEVEAALEKGEIARAVELMVRRWVDGPNRRPDQANPKVREKVLEMCTHAFATHYPERGTYEPLDPPAIVRLDEIRVPTLIIVGDQDVPYVLDIADRLGAGITGARKVVIPGVAHMVNMEKPEEFNQIVLEFLDAGARE